MRLAQLIYTSRPFGFDEAILDDILLAARVNNARARITGALICRADLYVQFLEGPRQAVTETFGRILRDDRHLELNLLHCSDTAERLFPAWTMRDDPPHSWMWTREEVRAGAARDALAMEAVDVFRRLATLPQAG